MRQAGPFDVCARRNRSQFANAATVKPSASSAWQIADRKSGSRSTTAIIGDDRAPDAASWDNRFIQRGDLLAPATLSELKPDVAAPNSSRPHDVSLGPRSVRDRSTNVSVSSLTRLFFTGPSTDASRRPAMSKSKRRSARTSDSFAIAGPGVTIGMVVSLRRNFVARLASGRSMAPPFGSIRRSASRRAGSAAMLCPDRQAEAPKGRRQLDGRFYARARRWFPGAGRIAGLFIGD